MMKEEIKKLGIIAGRGEMPVQIMESCLERGIEVFVLGLIPFADEERYKEVPHIMVRMGDAGKMIKWLKKNKVVDLVMAGGIIRPTLKEVMPDWEGTKILTKLAFKKLGDDGLFKAVIDEVEKRGFKIRAIEEVMEDMLFQEGVYGKIKPSKEDMNDIERGIEVVKALGAVDIGQATVVQEGLVLAVEAVEGTDRMLERAASVRHVGKKPILIKIKKPGQDNRTDMPAIGLHTIEVLKKYNMGGIAVEAGGILVIERDAVIKLANEEGIFIIGMKI